MAADRVRVVIERDFKSRAVPSRRPAVIEGDAPVEFFAGGADLRTRHWPESTTVEGTFKKRLVDWKFLMENKVETSDSDPRFAAAYDAAADAACAAFESWAQSAETAATDPMPLHVAFAAALKDAAAALRHEAAKVFCMDAAEAALDEGSSCGLPEASKEDYWLALSPRARVESAPAGGAGPWAALSSIVDGAVRPGFLSRLRDVAFASAELCAAYAPRRLESLAEYVVTLKPCHEPAALCGALDYILSLPANTLGEQTTSSSSIPFIHCAVLRWLFEENDGGTARELEEVLWRNFALAAAGGARAADLFDEDSLQERIKFPDSERLRLRTGVLVAATDKKLRY
jgi:hypothetical protein